jgi:hypothetical protein
VGWAGHVAHVGETNAYKVLVVKPDRRPLGGARRRWDDDIKMDLSEIGWSGMAWLHLA